jgi:sugar phosphate isomerase/epimerase
VRRREFLGAAAASALAATTGLRAGCQTNAWRIPDFPAFLGVLDRIHAHGYAGFETGFRNLQKRFDDAKATRSEIERRGLVFLGIHIFLLEYDPETSVAPWDLLASVADGGAALGAERLILSGRSVADPGARKKKAQALNRAGEHAKKRGLQLAYHNHDAEFRNGAAEIEELAASTDAGLVHFVMDAGHAWFGGGDAAKFLDRHHRRIDGMHLRDFRRRGASPEDPDPQVVLGQGVNDLAPLAAVVRKRGWRGWVINEEERLNDGRPGDVAIGPARAHIKKLFGV